MQDAYTLLGEVRRPWIDADALKAKFLRLSKEWHPDGLNLSDPAERIAANNRFADMNQAWRTLADPKERLLHLLELEAGEKPRDIQRIPPGTMDLFVEVGQTCKDCDTFLDNNPSVTSPMLQLQRMHLAATWIDRLQDLQKRISALRTARLDALAKLNPLWESAPDPIADPAARRASLPLDDLELIYRSLSYIDRWTQQIDERLVRLAT